MDDNLYQTPKANLMTNASPKGSAVKAILISAAVDIVGSLLFMVGLVIAYGAILIANGMQPEELREALNNSGTNSTLSLIGYSAGTLIDIYAGYLCAKIANHNEYRIVTLLAIVVVLISSVIGSSHRSLIKHLLLATLTVVSLFLGARLRMASKQKMNRVSMTA